MVDLLENVQTDGLRKAFDKYIAVIDGKLPAKKKATLQSLEAKEITGNKESTLVEKPKKLMTISLVSQNLLD